MVTEPPVTDYVRGILRSDTYSRGTSDNARDCSWPGTPVRVAGAGEPCTPRRRERALRLFPRRTLFHRLWPAARLGLCRPASRRAAPGRVVTRHLRRFHLGLPSVSRIGDECDRRADGGVHARGRRRPLRPMARGPVRVVRAVSASRGRAVLYRSVPAAELARACLDRGAAGTEQK